MARRRTGKPRTPPDKHASTAEEYRLWAESYEHVARIIGGNFPDKAEQKLAQAAEWRRYADHLERQAEGRRRNQMLKPPRMTSYG